MRVVGLETGRGGAIAPPLSFARGGELARFEMGSTIVLLAPRGLASPLAELREGQKLKLGQPIGRYLGA
jgi:phosphatidylserine decarboxylase